MPLKIGYELAAIIIAGLICTATTSKSPSLCSPKFDRKCSCGLTTYDYREMFVVNCTNNGFTNTSVLEYMPSEVEVVIFTGNFLTTLPWNVFGTINEYPKLKIVDMSNNHIREIHGKTYHHVQSVERLILNHNNLSISATEDELNYLHPRVFSNFINLKELHLTNAFADYTSSSLSSDLHSIFVKSNLTKLTKLHLEQNEIEKFKDRNVFCDLPMLKDLHLGDNNLQELNFNVLCLEHLRFLDLERNQFQTVHVADLELLSTLENLAGRTDNLVVDFTYNPFTCDCNVFHFVNWLKNTRVTVRHAQDLMCYRTTDYSERMWTLQFRKCKVQSYDHQTTSGHTVTLVFLLAVLSFIMVALVGALVYVSKDRIKHFISPVVSSRKVHYTTIKDDEIHEVHV